MKKRHPDQESSRVLPEHTHLLAAVLACSVLLLNRFLSVRFLGFQRLCSIDIGKETFWKIEWRKRVYDLPIPYIFPPRYF
jgi:hypothetical protein